ncbi:MULTISPECIES: metal ABC transporter permease [unclassified Arthrobacter]|uniref:metal ABC transporter permease n=1 Tax=unclassified Arthrobacter TaxID=235627 RepID=UPI0014911326|nr:MULTISPECIES: metal ABC transporter permease [unclassified Arthrobacter]MBE0008631.1 metal ABC transporter permease [Arthrobacter sp. AET 35A]NOJ58599.1 metal ABC transporter permease [Arthrobacter sp. 260]NOJ62464.1 metal ABC transporter permease [Arthrobacter sp. 147(2020)]
MEFLSFLTEPLQYGFLTRALVVTVCAAVVASVLSCWLILMGWSLMGDAVSHAVLPGVALAYIIGIPFSIGAFVFGAGAVALIGVVKSTTKLKSDTVIGVVFTGLFAVGLAIVSRTPSQVDLMHILFGNVLGVTDGELWQVVILGALTLAVVLYKRRDLTLFAFDRTHAHVIGLNTRALSTLLLGLMALSVVVGLQAVGIILVVAMLITPGATAFLLTRSFDLMLILAASITTVASVAGIYASYYLDISTGAAVVLSQSLVFVLVYLFARRTGIIWQAVTRRRLRRTTPPDDVGKPASLQPTGRA